jgi:MFS family permease
LVAAVLASVIAYIDESVVNVALPAIAENLAASIAVIQWVINAYTLCLAAFLLVGGAAGDRIGRRRVFIVGITIFAIASVWCGLSPNVAQLIIARAKASALRFSSRVRWRSLAHHSPRPIGAKPSGPGPAFPRLPPLSVRCWAAGLSTT